jgi:hypothetical protein
MTLPLFSIVTPSYNQAAFLDLTMRSVLEQDYPALEYINKGFARITGEYAAWLNSDDLYLPGALRTVAQAFEEHPEVGLVFGDVVSIDGAGQPINVMTFGPRELDELMCFQIISQPGVFMRRSLLEQTGLLDPSYHFLLDHHLWLRAAMRAPTLYLPQRLAAARFHAGAKNVAQAAAFGREAFRIIDWMQTQPALQEPYHRLKKRIRAGAERFDARYLQDGGRPRAALEAYLRSLAAHPPTALPEWRRMLYALASLVVDPERLKQRYLARRKNRLNLP